MPMPPKKHNEGIRIVKVAAFCFALISWFATAQGLYQYVFKNRYWQALLISFGIQSILFVFNLKLPEYLHQCVTKYPGETNYEKSVKNKGIAGKIAMCFLYLLVISASSFFSFVYITNYVYADTRYADADVVLDQRYRTYLDDTYRYLNEYSKFARLIISEQLSELQELIPLSEETQTEAELDKRKNEALQVKNIAENRALIAENDYLVWKDIMSTPDTIRWRSKAEHDQERESYEQAKSVWESASEELAAAELAYQNAESDHNAYKPSAALSVRGILEEVLKPEPDDSVIEEYLNALMNQIMETNDSDINIERFAEVVHKTQIVTVVVKNYLDAREALSSSAGLTDLRSLQEGLVHDNSSVPQLIGKENGGADSEFITQKQEWEDYWKTRFQLLARFVKNAPRMTEIETIDYQGIVDTGILNSYTPQVIVDDIDDILRTNLEDINVVERAFALLNSKYSFLARFSLGLAVFLDLSSMLAGLFIYHATILPQKKAGDKTEN